MLSRHLTGLPLVLLAVACARDGRFPDRARVEAEWTGSDTGAISARGTAEWCDTLRMLEIRAVQGDSGLAIVLYPADSVGADSYPVLPPVRADSTPPAGAVALRWFAETAIKGFRGDSGAVVVTEATPAGISGRFGVRVRSVNDDDRLRVSGRFRGLPVVPASRGCAARETPADSGVD